MLRIGDWVQFEDGTQAPIQGWQYLDDKSNIVKCSRNVAYLSESGRALVAVWNAEQKKLVYESWAISKIKSIPAPVLKSR